MSTPTLRQVIEALGARVGTVEGLRAFDHVPLATEYPCAFVVPPVIDYRKAFRFGLPTLELEVVVLVSAVESRYQKQLFDFLGWSGPASLVAALDADKTLGLPGVDCVAMDSRALTEPEMAGYRSYGAALRCIITVNNPQS